MNIDERIKKFNLQRERLISLDGVITFENISRDEYITVISGKIVNYIERVLFLIKQPQMYKDRDYAIFIERFNAYRGLTIHNNEVYLVREGLNYYWKGLDSKNRAISMYRLQHDDFSKIKVVEKFSDLPPYIESLNPLD